MKDFANLFRALDSTTKTSEKVQALVRFFEVAEEKDKLWTIALLSHRRPRRIVKTSLLREWAAEMSQIPLWLLEESYHVIGDLAETLALILPPGENNAAESLTGWMDKIASLHKRDEAEKKALITTAWLSLGKTERFVFNKLITGGFRMGVSQKLLVKALSKYLSLDENALAHRIMGEWNPNSTTFNDLLLAPDSRDWLSQPYPFYLAYPVDESLKDLGDVSSWQLEYKWDGIRGQLIVRQGEIYVWSRGEELITDRFPEFLPLADKLPDGTVLDGEILCFQDGKPLPFQKLQKRIGRKTISKKLLLEAPVIFMAYDLLEWQKKDIRDFSLQNRRDMLTAAIEKVTTSVLHISESLEVNSWKEAADLRESSRENGTEGLMIKQKESNYGVGRKRGDWWKWKVDALTIDAVLIYAMRGHGRRANLYTDYTFAVWDNAELVPFTKAYSGLTDAELKEVDRFVKANTLERFGPVRSVNPELVFEIAFEGLAPSTRHKSGIAVRFPRIHRWRKDKPASEADTLQNLWQLIPDHQKDAD